MTTAANPTLRHHLEPGDPEAITDLHRRIYCEEQGFVSLIPRVAERGVRAALASGWPEAGGVWLAELEGRVCGSLGLTFEGQAGDGLFTGTIKWFALELELRGTGLARRMFEELIDTAEDQGIDRLEVYTLAEFEPAIGLYRSYGFELVYQRTRLDLRADGAPVVYQQYATTL